VIQEVLFEIQEDPSGFTREAFDTAAGLPPAVAEAFEQWVRGLTAEDIGELSAGAALAKTSAGKGSGLGIRRSLEKLRRLFREARLQKQADPWRFQRGSIPGRANALRGNAFEREVLESLGLPKNRDIYIGQLPSGAFKTTIPDIVKSGNFGIADIKDVRYASFSSQLRAQAELADYFNRPFSLIVSSSTQKVSLPLQRAIRASGGKVFEFDSATGELVEVAFDLVHPNRIVR
jgi:hypothetical protein